MDLGKPAPRNSRTAADISRESHVRKKWMFSNHMLYRIFVQNCVIWTSKNNCQMLIFGEASIWTVQRLWVVILYFCPIGRLTYMGQFCLSQKWPNPGLFNSNFGRSLKLSGLVLMAPDSFYLTNTSARVTPGHQFGQIQNFYIFR